MKYIIGLLGLVDNMHSLRKKERKKNIRYHLFFTNFLFVLDTHDYEEECNSHLL